MKMLIASLTEKIFFWSRGPFNGSVMVPCTPSQEPLRHPIRSLGTMLKEPLGNPKGFPRSLSGKPRQSKWIP